MSAAAELPLDQLDVITPDSFEEHGYPHDGWARLRRESPIHFFGDSPVPFWAITKHADITSISKQPDLFLNGPRLFVHPEVAAVGRFARLPDRGRDISAPASGSTWPQRLSVRLLWNHTEVSLLSGSIRFTP